MRKWLAISVLGIALLPAVSFAQISTGSTGLTATGDNVYGTTHLSQYEGSIGVYIGTQIITPFFSILGILFLVLMIYGGVIWMTSTGDSASITKAKSILVRAVLGLIIILLSYGFTQFVFEAIT
jgi:hypothetical protein